MTRKIVPIEQAPRLRSLQEALEAGDQSALEAFWKEAGERGTPLIEPDENNRDCSLVTFLWRAGDKVENVVVFGQWSDFDLDDSRMTRLPSTNCWHRAYRMPNQLRASYWLAPNDSLVPWREMKSYEDYVARMANFRTDPLNPRTLLFPGDDPNPSILELPNAEPQPWSTSAVDVPQGEVTCHRFASKILGNECRVWTYLPPGYKNSGEPCGLLVVFDGEVYLTTVPTPVILNNLLAAGRIEPMVAVIVDNGGGNDQEQTEARNRELPCHPPFADFLAIELVPWVRAKYRVSSNPARTVVAGSSFGGLAAAYAAFRYPEIFGNVLSQSGAFQWKPGHDPFDPRPDEEVEDEWLVRQYAESPRLPLRLYLDVGVFDSRTLPGGRPGIVIANRHLRNVLRARGYPLHYKEFCGGHDYLWWRGTLADGLLMLVGHGRVD